MEFGVIVLIWCINFAISWFNAWAVGNSWAETSKEGGWPHFVNWSAAVMSAAGFTWCYLLVLGFGIHAFGKLDMKYVMYMLQLGYLTIIIPILGSGLALTADSWAHFYRNRSWKNGAVAGWNTFAQIYNTIDALEAVPDALGAVKDMFSGDSDDDNKSYLVILLVVIALIGGVLTTFSIIRSAMKSHCVTMSYEIGREKRAALKR